MSDEFFLDAVIEKKKLKGFTSSEIHTDVNVYNRFELNVVLSQQNHFASESVSTQLKSCSVRLFQTNSKNQHYTV